MARIKGAVTTRRRHKKILKLAKGYWGGKSKLFRTANEAVMKSLRYAYVGRRQRKRDFRRLWITRISAGAKANGLNYSRFRPYTIKQPSPRWRRKRNRCKFCKYVLSRPNGRLSCVCYAATLLTMALRCDKLC